ncbi:lipoprotein N-acyltransferase Lnb domain-containing protein [Dyella sp. 2RAB6]|uniref:lipoprotein N-acyltransferase Lnb domain-containing protein n=1 Tax=Dyella sp. 2RAB6 TaxID=3232992 RepID=UPI003F936D24
MSLIARTLLLFALLGAAFAQAQASVANAPGANLEVALVTYGPGETYWERFGHDAIQVRDTVSGESVDFNYGVFDFDESGFLLNFARGRMHYLMDGAYTEQDQRYYIESGRSVTRQLLALTPEQAAALRDFLLWNLRPENARYDYDYYADNCTTRVRDALDHALGGVIRKQLQGRAGLMTYRQQTARLMSAQPWLMLILDLGLGPYADQPLTAWQESFLPMVLQRELAAVNVDYGAGGTRRLAGAGELLSPNRLDVPPEQAPKLLLPLALAGLVFAALLIVAARRWPTGLALLGTLYLVAAGIVGLLLLVLWTLTTHHSAWANANLLLFNPLAFLLLPSLWRARRGLAASRLADRVILLQLIALAVALGLHVWPGTVQQNQPWLLFAIPCWLALSWSLRRGLRRLRS